MGNTTPFATRIPGDLARALDEACAALGMRKNYVVEQALREWLEDALDARDLREAIGSATGFHEWRGVRGAAEGSTPYRSRRIRRRP